MADEVPMLQLPDPCLVAVLRCCAGDMRSLFSAARSHSRLQQAAAEVLTSISVGSVKWQHIDSVLTYLSKHGRHVDSLYLAGFWYERAGLWQLPPILQLTSLKLDSLSLLLQPNSLTQGLLRPELPLKQLQLSRCELLDGAEGLTAALALLPGLQHLSISATDWDVDRRACLPAAVLAQLQQLTYLELVNIKLQHPGQPGHAQQSRWHARQQNRGADVLQPLQALTQLADLRLHLAEPTVIDSSVLAGMQDLTRLEVSGKACFHWPGALVAVTQLQHLRLALQVPAAGLAQLKEMQQLTHLQISNRAFEEVAPPLLGGFVNWLAPVVIGAPAEAFSALTASSQLRYLDISRCRLPAGAWQHIFPAGHELPHLQSLNISGVEDGQRSPLTAPEGSLLVSCCPGLQSLDMQHLQYSAGVLGPLQELSGLHTLRLATHGEGEGLEAVCQLTGLRELTLSAPTATAEGLLLELTRLTRLTSLAYSGPVGGVYTYHEWASQGPGDRPVWSQVMWHLLEHKYPEVAEQAALALLAEW